MTDALIVAVTNLADRLVTLAAQDDHLRDDLRFLAEAVLAATDRQPRPSTPELGPPVAGTDGAYEAGLVAPLILEAEAGAVPEVVLPALPLPELTLGKPLPPPSEIRTEPPAPATRAISDADLPAIEARCRLKAEGIRWSATRRRRMDQGAEFRVEIAPRDREIVDRARDLGCYLWMNTPDFGVPNDPSAMENAAGWFEAVADAVALIREMRPDANANRAFVEPALDLLAKAQSALKVAIEEIGGPHDQDQYRIYDWLRGIAAREQIYIRRHMRLDDPADPADLSEMEERLEALDAKFQEVRQSAKRRKSYFNRLRYHAQRIARGSGGDHDWSKVAGTIDEMVGDGIPASNLEIREILLPILDLMPEIEDLPTGCGLVLREIDRYLANRMVIPEATTPEAPNAQVAEAARLLEGKSAVLIGGVRRPEAHEALKAAFGLKDLVWFETREHESIDVFEPYVARPEVALVILAIRWSSHSFEGVKKFCDDHEKPMVRLPGGYGVNQVAAQILAQCSEQLGGRFLRRGPDRPFPQGRASANGWSGSPLAETAAPGGELAPGR